MGGGTFTRKSFESYSVTNGKTYDSSTGYITGQTYHAHTLDEALNPRDVVRECVNSEEHPNTIPVILALDVTGSMGEACNKTAEALGVIVTNLFDKVKDVEFMIMGIGDLAYDEAPIQASQFESDVRIAEALDKVWMEKGGGGNAYESYSAAWYFGLMHTKLDCWEQGRKGIIITMGDEPLNPYLPGYRVKGVLGDPVQDDINTESLYKDAVEKFDIYHISINDRRCSYGRYANSIRDTWGKLLGQNSLVSTINELPNVIENCILSSVNSSAVIDTDSNENQNSGISW